MDRSEIQSQLSDVESRLQSENDVTVFNVRELQFAGFRFEEMPATDFVDQALDLDVSEFYVLRNRSEYDEFQRGGITYLHNGRPHTLILRPVDQDEDQSPAHHGGRGAMDFGLDESEEEKERKEQIADELLTEYREYIDEDEMFRIENRLDRINLSRLLHIHEEAEKQDKIDPDLEKELARAVYEREEFNQQFNETDTEMLLDQMESEFEEEKIRVHEVHTRAKSLLKINR